MSWFGVDPAAELDVKIEEATSESIPNGEMDMAVAMEITDVIRSKKVPPKQAMRGLKKRLAKVYANPNTLAAVLKLADVCVKNGGSHFLSEINSKEFIDYLVEYIFKVHYDVKNYTVYSSEAKYAIGSQILKLVKEWSLYVLGNPQQGNFLARAYANLSNQGYDFPAVDAPLLENALNFVDSATPPDWIDGRECMICYNPFSVMNRKHHCRACGGVFCQTHSSKTLPLVSLGILDPVRVCDDCFQIHKNAAGRGDNLNVPELAKVGKNTSADDEDEQLKRAIELSLQETSIPVSFDVSERPSMPPPGHVTATNNNDNHDDELDEEMKAAIAASLAEFQLKSPAVNSENPNPNPNPFSAPEPEQELDFYLNIMPLNAGAYLNAVLASFGGENNMPVQKQNTQTWEQGVPPQQRPADDLSPQEEEDISLFVQLMGGIKNDPAKQANILHDQKLGELHSKVVRLKPKLNRALRASIEKYEFFLEMNNKINSITRLYDQFLDHKLNLAYNKHIVSLPLQPEVPLYGQQQFFMQRNRPHEPLHEVQYQPTGSLGEEVHAQVPVLNEHSPQKTGYLYKTSAIPQHHTGTRHSEVPVTPLQSFQQPKGESSVPYPADTGLDNLGPTCYGQNEPSYANTQMPVYPQVPSSPPSDGLSEAESDAESAASRYPALEDKYSAEDVLGEGTKAHASSRFPLLNELNLPELGTEPPAGLRKQTTNDSRKYRAEPEPLIEL